MTEIWVQIQGFETYSVSNCGRIRNHSGKFLIPTPDGKGYPSVSLCRDGVATKRTLHRIVAEAFIPNLECKPTVNHIDGDKSNNSVWNLEWATYSENNLHAYKHGLSSPKRIVGEKNGRAKLNTITVNQIKNLLSQGIKANMIAGKFNVSPTTIGRIKLGIIWK